LQRASESTGTDGCARPSVVWRRTRRRGAKRIKEKRAWKKNRSKDEIDAKLGGEPRRTRLCYCNVNSYRAMRLCMFSNPNGRPNTTDGYEVRIMPTTHPVTAAVGGRVRWRACALVTVCVCRKGLLSYV